MVINEFVKQAKNIIESISVLRLLFARKEDMHEKQTFDLVAEETERRTKSAPIVNVELPLLEFVGLWLLCYCSKI